MNRWTLSDYVVATALLVTALAVLFAWCMISSTSCTPPACASPVAIAAAAPTPFPCMGGVVSRDEVANGECKIAYWTWRWANLCWGNPLGRKVWIRSDVGPTREMTLTLTGNFTSTITEYREGPPPLNSASVWISPASYQVLCGDGRLSDVYYHIRGVSDAKYPCALP